MTTEHRKPVESGERAELIDCPDCGGQGYDADVTTDGVFKDTCQRCNGKGTVEASDENVRDEGCAFARREDHEYPGESGDAYLAGFKRAAALLTADDKAGGYAKALEIRTEQGGKLTGEAIPVLYTDTINGQQVFRDDVWLCTTAALRKEDDKAGVMTPEKINEVNETLWAELDEIKENTGYNAYREANRGLAHWTLLGYLLNLKHRADDKAGGEAINGD